jgi:DNA-binding LytR/AlgR family response regulator
MKIAICDDEEKLRRLLAEKIARLFPEDTVESYESGEAMLGAADEPDVLLLDIKMPGISGMETAKKIRLRNEMMIIIFITGEDQYVYDSFDVQAFHFLVKPFKTEKLKEVLERAKQQYSKDTGSGDKRYTMITAEGSHIRLYLNDVIYAEVFDSKVIVHTVNEDISYYGKLTDLEKTAGEGFFRTHRAYLVNMKYIIRYDSSNVYFDHGKALMSKQNYPVFVKELMKYNEKKGFFA